MAVPIPPGAEGPNARTIEVQVVDAPKAIEEPKTGLSGLRSIFSRAWAAVKAAAKTVYRWVAVMGGAATYAVMVAASYTVTPVLDFIEYWVPGMGQFRAAAFYYGLGLIIVGAVVGGLLFGQAGYTLPMVFFGMLWGASLIPWIIVTTPSLWAQLAMDVWVLSTAFVLIDAVIDAIQGRIEGGWAGVAHRLAPGITNTIIAALGAKKIAATVQA